MFSGNHFTLFNKLRSNFYSEMQILYQVKFSRKVEILKTYFALCSTNSDQIFLRIQTLYQNSVEILNSQEITSQVGSTITRHSHFFQLLITSFHFITICHFQWVLLHFTGRLCGLLTLLNDSPGIVD